MKSSLFEIVSEGTFRARFLMRNSGFDLVCLLVYGIPTFDSESFELELNGYSMGCLVAPLARVSSKTL